MEICHEVVSIELHVRGKDGKDEATLQQTLPHNFGTLVVHIRMSSSPSLLVVMERFGTLTGYLCTDLEVRA